VTETMLAAGTVSNSNTMTWGVSVPFDLGDFQGGSFSYTSTYSNSVQSSNQFSVEIIFPNFPTTYIFNVGCVGSPNPGYGEVVDVWLDS
jgi:hypothetical protein